MNKYITVNELAKLTVYSKQAIRAKIKKGHWLQGEHFYKSPDGRIHIDYPAIKNWIESPR